MLGTIITAGAAIFTIYGVVIPDLKGGNFRL
jgi:hypothetical protein